MIIQKLKEGDCSGYAKRPNNYIDVESNLSPLIVTSGEIMLADEFPLP